MDLDVEANITVEVDCSSELVELVQVHLEFIAHEERAQSISFGKNKGYYTKVWKIENENITVSISTV